MMSGLFTNCLLVTCISLATVLHADAQIMSSQTVQPLSIHAYNNNSNTPNIEILHRCQAFIHEFGLASASYMHCAILHSRPFNFCSMCAKEYALAMYLYDTMKTITDDVDPKRTCEDIMLSGDKIMLATQARMFVKDTWKDSNCNNCFEEECVLTDLTNGTVNCTLANHTTVFFENHADTLACLNNFTNTSKPMHGVDQTESVGCDICQELYTNLNNFYIEIEANASTGLCMDIVDAMNDTRRIWSKQLYCTHTKGDMAAIVSLTAFFCILPIVFYISSKLHGEREEKKLLKQKRMKNFITRSAAEESTSGNVAT